MFWSKMCKSNWISAWNPEFPVFISPIVWNMGDNLHYESVYFKELHNEQEYYWPTICRAGAAVVSPITSYCGGRVSSVGRALDDKAGGRGFDSQGRTNTQGLKITEKWRFAWLGWSRKMVVPSPVKDVKIVSPSSTFVLNTLTLQKSANPSPTSIQGALVPRLSLE